MTLPRYALAYHRCSTAELQTFFKQRTGEDAPMGLRHSDYIKTLHDLDRQATFRFLDMLPEIRNLIYVAALSYTLGAADNHGAHKRRSNASPQLLRTSKQIYREARGILYAESTLSVDILSGSYWIEQDVEVDTYTEISGDVVQELDRVLEPPSALDVYAHAWPECIRDVAKIDLTIQLCDTTTRSWLHQNANHFYGANLVLDRLACLLAQSEGQRKHLHIRLVDADDGAMESSTWRTILYPVSKMCAVHDVTFEGMDAQLESSLRFAAASMQCSYPMWDLVDSQRTEALLVRARRLTRTTIVKENLGGSTGMAVANLNVLAGACALPVCITARKDQEVAECLKRLEEYVASADATGANSASAQEAGRGMKIVADLLRLLRWHRSSSCTT